MHGALENRGTSLLFALALAACGGESSKSGSDDSTSNTSNSGASNGGASSGGSSSTGNTGGTNCSGGDPIDPGCFGSPGPVTNGSTASVGAGGNTATNTTSGSSGGSGGGFAGAGGAGGATCEPQDVAGIAFCDATFGVFFLGDHCRWIGGCSCEGEDCDNGYDDEASCEAAHRECLNDSCAVRDVTFVGGCEPASVYAFNGVECVAMSGCSCVGDDCDATYSSLDDCKAAHAVCESRERTCNQLTALHDDYVSHTACQDDSDCVMVWGLCGVGLGRCYHTINRRWGREGLSAIGDAWKAADCGGAVCACAEPPETVICDDGVCAFQE